MRPQFKPLLESTRARNRALPGDAIGGSVDGVLSGRRNCLALVGEPLSVAEPVVQSKLGGGFFFPFFFYIIYLLLRYKKLHAVLVLAKTKPKIKNKQTKETSVADHLQKAPYRSLAHIRA